MKRERMRRDRERMQSYRLKCKSSGSTSKRALYRERETELTESKDALVYFKNKRRVRMRLTKPMHN